MLNVIEALEESDEEERSFVVCELLAEADTRAGVKGEEDEGVGGDVGLDALVEEAVGVEFVGCGVDWGVRSTGWGVQGKEN